MTLINCDFSSDSLGMGASLTALVPDPALPPPRPEGYPVLYLLHGLGDDHTTWIRRTAIERYVAGMPLVIVMPGGHRSMYADAQRGLPYERFIGEELPALCEHLLPISPAARDRFIGGLSMGGYGALRVGLHRPQRYAGIATLSGVTGGLWLDSDQTQLSAHELTNIFGPGTIGGTANDPMEMLKTAAAAGPVPPIFQCCGSDDFLIFENYAFRDVARKLDNVELTWEEGEGEHNWLFWDRSIRRVLEWLPITEG
jgi:putative tributyrin esterase